MAEAAADTSKGMTKADQILSKLDSISSRQDSIEKKADAALAASDAKGRKDGDLALEVKPKESEEVVGGEKDPAKEDSKKKADATITVSDAAKRKDGGGGFQNEGKEGQDPPKDKDWDKKDSKKADGSKRADRDKDEDTSVSNVTKGSGDSAAADAKKRADWDDDDKDKDDSKKADARADAWEMRLKALEERHTMPEETMAEFTNAQAFADEAYQMHSKRAPASLPGETLAIYKRRLVTPLRKFSPQWGAVKMTDLPDEAFVNIEKMIYADAIAAAQNPTDLEPGEQRKVVKTDPDTGMKQIMWYGPESFIKGLGRPGRRVVSFLNRNQQPI